MNELDYDVESKDDMQIPSLSANRRVGELSGYRYIQIFRRPLLDVMIGSVAVSCYYTNKLNY